jgi:HAD superfamily hydrolase (TIGR01509 family)
MTHNGRVRAVVFDLDGLLFNTEDVFEVTGQELARRLGTEMTDEVRRQMMGRRAVEAFKAMKEGLGLPHDIEELSTLSLQLFYELLDERLAPMPGVFEFLEHLERAALPTAVATSSHRGYLENILGRYDLLGRFTFFLTAEDVDRGKPDPQIYLKAAERLGFEPKEILVCEDSGAGAAAAVAAGAVVVAIPHRHSAHHNFSGAALIAESLADPRLFALVNGDDRTP